LKSNQEVFIGKKVKRVGLQRYLVSKICFEVDKVVLADLICLFENQLWLESKALTDREFNTKFGSTLEVVTLLLKELNLSQGLNARALLKFSSRLKSGCQDFLFPPRNYASMKAKFSGTYTPRYRRPTGTPNKLLPPIKYIGKGYGDKGTAQIPELDASPSWQDVATAVSNKERMTHEKLREEMDACKTADELISWFRGRFAKKPDETKPTKRRGDKSSEKVTAGTKKARGSW
jgi:hypothetical protein